LIAYFIGNISAKKYQNPFICVKVIASQRWDVFETRYSNDAPYLAPFLRYSEIFAKIADFDLTHLYSAPPLG